MAAVTLVDADDFRGLAMGQLSRLGCVRGQAETSIPGAARASAVSAERPADGSALRGLQTSAAAEGREVRTRPAG